MPNSQIDRLIAAGKSVHSGLVDSATEAREDPPQPPALSPQPPTRPGKGRYGSSLQHPPGRFELSALCSRVFDLFPCSDVPPVCSEREWKALEPRQCALASSQIWGKASDNPSTWMIHRKCRCMEVLFSSCSGQMIEWETPPRQTPNPNHETSADPRAQASPSEQKAGGNGS